MQFGFEFLITQKIEGYRGLLLGAEFYEGVTVSSRGHLKEWVGFEYRSASKLYGIFVSVSSEMAQRKLQEWTIFSLQHSTTKNYQFKNPICAIHGSSRIMTDILFASGFTV